MLRCLTISKYILLFISIAQEYNEEKPCDIFF